MRISDWSSDVCSSDLSGRAGDERADLVDPGGTGCLIRGLEVQSEQRLGVRCPQVEPPLPEVDGEAVEAILGISGVRGGHLLDDGEGVGNLEVDLARRGVAVRSEEHTSELQSIMRLSYAVLCLNIKKQQYK